MGLCEAYCAMIISVFDCMHSRLVTAQYVCSCRKTFSCCFVSKKDKLKLLR